jgi:hypothetical protein
VANVDGKVTVLKAGGQWEVLGVNDIGEPIHATPALAGGRIYVRTRAIPASARIHASPAKLACASM